MVEQLTNLIFLSDPLRYQARPDETCVLVPTGISTAEKLLGSLRENLPLPEHSIDNWNSLYDVLRSWDDWQTIPRRVVILHSDLPLLDSGRDGFFDLQTYLKILIDSISALQEKNVAEIDPLQRRELVAIFPTQVKEQVQQVLSSPPAWDLMLSFFDYDDFYTLHIDPSWPTALQYLGYLNGVTSEICTLSRTDLGRMTIHYNKHTNAYCALYESPDQQTWMVASEEEEPASSPQISFALASQIMETFFTSGKLLDSVHWLELSSSAYSDLLHTLKHSYYRNDEEVLVEKDMHRTRSTIGQGLKEALGKGKKAYTLAYWQEVLTESETSLSQRLAALCAIGLSTLADAPSLLRPFLKSPVKQERWVSTRFCALWQDDEALPILLSMLTDELPLATEKHAREDDYYWYNDWRRYAPRLLRKWQTPEVGQHLHRALITWVQAQSQFDPDDAEIWELFEGEICYELGYRGDFTVLHDLPLEGKHKQALSYQMEQGRRAKRS